MNVDVNFGSSSPQHPRYNRHQVLQKYVTALRQLRTIAEQTYNVRPYYFDNYVTYQYFQQRSHLDKGQITQDNFSLLAFFKVELLRHILDRRRQILTNIILVILLAFIIVFGFRHETNNSERNVHHFIIYPGLRYWRRITLPLIKRFPRLTELYDESCLMENPFYQLRELSCDPCANLENVLDLTQLEQNEKQNDKKTNEGDYVDANIIIDNDDIKKYFDGNSRELPSQYVPFIFKMNQNPIELDDLYKIYAANQEIFQRDAYRVQSTLHDINNLEELFDKFNYTDNKNKLKRPRLEAHNRWRSNRMLPARLLRQLFERPPRLPRTGIALERYMAIDTPLAPTYTLPETKCANTYIQQALGTRFIILRPTSECKQKCRTLSLRLPQSSVLSYNWWYWKPISAPDPASDTFSISLIGSYC